jgi:DNA-binding MarR family transcriptional regulator
MVKATVSSVEDSVSRIGDALTSVFRASHAVRMHERVSAAAGVPLDRALFVMLARLGVEGDVRVSDLADRMGLDVSTVSRQAQQLEATGLLERRPAPGDRRVAVLSLTGEGRRVLRKLRAERHRLLEAMLGGWAERDRERLGALLERFAAEMEKVGRDT